MALPAAVTVAIVMAHEDLILQAAAFSQFPANGRFKQIDVMLLQPFVKEFVWDLNGQGIVIQAHRFDGFEPGLKTLLVYVLANSLKTVIPDCRMISCHRQL